METNYSIKDIQDSILTVIKDIDIFCREHDIKYYLMGGSALGAMRHKGFIPWDDDLDIFMTYDEYHRFIKLFQEYTKNDEKYKKYFLQIENTDEWPLFITRVCLTGTTLISDEFKHNLKQHHNIFVDIMCLYSAPENTITRRVQYLAAQMLRVNALARCGFQNKNIGKTIVLFLSKIIVNPLTKPFLIKYVCKYEGKNVDYKGHYFGRARFWNTSFSMKYIGNQRYVDFEDTHLPVFEFVEDYLVARFGEKWMEMPSKSVKDMYPIHGNFVDLTKDYTEYIDKDKKQWIYMSDDKENN